MISYHLRNNETDFEKWCRKYIKRARCFIDVYENNLNRNEFRISHYDHYQESLKIMRQYQTLICALDNDKREFLEKCLIGNEDYDFRNVPYKHYRHLIFLEWQEICFPDNKPQSKNLDSVKVGDSIKYFRERSFLSRSSAADYLEINLKTLNAYESGERMVKLEVVYKMSILYKTSIDEIISRSMLDF